MFILLLPLFLAEAPPLSAAELFDRGTTSELRLAADGATIEIERGVLYEDDGPAAGYSYRPNDEKVAGETRIKKELLVDPRATAATLLIGGKGTWTLRLNGTARELSSPKPVGNYWHGFSLSPDWLTRGKNEIVLGGSGQIWIARDDEFAAGSATRTEHPNRSAKSNDGGQTWDDQRLGMKGNVDGEYYVRLFLDQHRPRGVLTTPVFDATLKPPPLVPPLARVIRVELDWQAELPTDTHVRLLLRTGKSPAIGDGLQPAGWSDWRPLPSGKQTVSLDPATGRYFQLRAELSTSNPLVTPRLRQISLRPLDKPEPSWADGVSVVRQQNKRLIRSSIPFVYEPLNHPRLRQLREQEKLDDVVRGAETELELLSRLAKWSASRWVHPGHIGSIYPAWDAADILRTHPDGKPVGGFCQQYNVVFLQACESFGFVGRAVSIGPGDPGGPIRGGHEVVEIWSNEHGKWMYIDGNLAWYAVDKSSRVPLSLWELRDRQLTTLGGGEPAAIEIVSLLESRQPWTGLASWPPFVELRLIPRSNFLTATVPLPLNQGMRGWFWTGHHAWTDERSPASLLYSQRESKRANWEWSVQETEIALEATSQPGELRVFLDTLTPSFDRFNVQLGGHRPEPMQSGLLWKLESTPQRISVSAENVARRRGPSSWLEIARPNRP